MVRAFFGLALEDAARTRLEPLLAELAATGAPVRWVRPESMHLTVKFLGEIEEARIDSLCELVGAIGSLAGGPIDLALAGVTTLGSRRKPRVVALDVREPTGRLVALAREVEEAAAAEGFEPEARPYAAHVTLGRIKFPKHLDALIEAIERLRDADFGVSRAGALVLFRSETTREGARYHPLRTFPLAGELPP